MQQTIERTTLNRMWMAKMGLVMLIGLALGTWGLLDALWLYPRRGMEDASSRQLKYLEAAEAAGTLADASVPRPGDEYPRLVARRAELEKAVAEKGRGTPAQQAEQNAKVRDAALLGWLDSLNMLWRVSPSYTTIADPAAELSRLRAVWEKKPQPTPLSWYDMPLQYVYVVVGYVVFLWVLRNFLRVRGQVYGWEAGENRLHLPGGRTLTPADLKDVDKRKWDKFYVYLQLKTGEPELFLDLYPHVPLEDWVLKMEEVAFPDRAEKEEPAAAAAGGAEGGAAAGGGGPSGAGG